MGKNLRFLLLVIIYIFSFYGCSLGSKNFSFEKKKNEAVFNELELETEEGGILLHACSFGKTPQEARASALKELSEQIFVKVKTSSYLKKERKAGKASSYYQATALLKSESYLKGIKVSAPVSINGSYKVCVYFTNNALKATIDFLKTNLEVDLEKLNRAQLKELLNKAYYLLGIAFLSPNKKEIEEFAKKKIETINTYLNYGRLVINTIPENASVFINGKEYKPFTCIFLPGEREYLVEVKAPGYREKTFKVFLAKGDRVTKTIELQKFIKKKIKVFVYCKYFLLAEKAKEFLVNSGFEVSQNPLAPNAILIKFRDVTSQVDEYIKHNINIVIEAYKGEKLFFSLSGKMKPFYTTKEVDKEILEKKAFKLLEVVLRRFVNQLDVEKFMGEKDFDYKFLFNTK